MPAQRKSPRKLVVFALDHVLYDDRRAFKQYAAGVSAFLAERGVAHDPNNIVGYQRLLRDKHGNLPGAVLLSREFSTSLAEVESRCYVSIDLDIAGVPSSSEDRAATLQALDAYKVAQSSVPGGYAEKVIRHLGLDAYFDEILGCETITSPKSESSAFAQLTARYPDFDEYWLVDSSPGNITRGSACGWRTVAFVGDSAADAIGSGAVLPADGHAIESIGQLLAIINGK